jgi:hypothetical protein
MEENEFDFTQNSIFDYIVEQKITHENSNIDSIKNMYDRLYDTLTKCERSLLLKYKKNIQTSPTDIFNMCTIICISFILNTDFFFRMTNQDNDMYVFIQDFASDIDKNFKLFYDVDFFKLPLVHEIVQIHLDNLYTFQSNNWKEITEDVYEPINIISYDDIDRFETYFFTGLTNINSFNKFVKTGLNFNKITNTDKKTSFIQSNIPTKRWRRDDKKKLNFTHNYQSKSRNNASNYTQKSKNSRQDTTQRRRGLLTTIDGGYKKNKTKKYYKKNYINNIKK